MLELKSMSVEKWGSWAPKHLYVFHDLIPSSPWMPLIPQCMVPSCLNPIITWIESILSPWWRHEMVICAGNSPVLHKGQWRGALMFSLICVWINGWVNNRKAGDLRRHRAHYDVIVMTKISLQWTPKSRTGAVVTFKKLFQITSPFETGFVVE